MNASPEGCGRPVTLLICGHTPYPAVVEMSERSTTMFSALRNATSLNGFVSLFR